MKKSELYRLAMVAVVESESLNSEQMVDLIEVLVNEKNFQKILEEAEA